MQGLNKTRRKVKNMVRKASGRMKQTITAKTARLKLGYGS